MEKTKKIGFLSKCFKGKNEMGWNLEPCKGCLSFKSPIIFTKT